MRCIIVFAESTVHFLQLEKAAIEKWGSMPEVEAERNAREQKRLKRALKTAGMAFALQRTCGNKHAWVIMSIIAARHTAT